MSALILMLARLPRGLWFALGAMALLLLVWGWHGREVRQARLAGAAEQAALDKAVFEAAATEAAARQGHLVRELAAVQAEISKGVDDELAVDFADVTRRYNDLRLRWAAARGDGAASQGGAVTLSRAASAPDDATCAARGWVDFETAAAAAYAADQAIAKDDAWISWAHAQTAAWPE